MKKFIGFLSVLMLGLFQVSCGNENNTNASSNNDNKKETETKETEKYSDITGEYVRDKDNNVKIILTETEFISSNYTYTYTRISENIIYVNGQGNYYLVFNDSIIYIPENIKVFLK